MAQRKFLWLAAWTTCLVLVLAALPTLASASDVSIKVDETTRVRSGPGTTYSVIGLLFSSDSAEVTGRDSTTNSWLRINFDEGEGWVSSAVVTLQGDPTTLEIVIPANAVSTVGNTDVTATAATGVNVRFGPGTQYPVLGQTDDTGDTTFDVTGRSAFTYPLICQRGYLLDLSDDDDTDSVWLRINFNGFNGWIAYSVVTVNGNLCDVEETAADSIPDEVRDEIEAQRGQVTVVTRNNVNLRSSNYAAADVLVVIPYETTLTAEARNSDSSRIRVTYQDQVGWLAVSQLEVVLGDVTNLPIEEA